MLRQAVDRNNDIQHLWFVTFAWQLVFNSLFVKCQGSSNQSVCVEEGPFSFETFSTEFMWRIMAIPEFHRSPSGFQARCSWVIGSRRSAYMDLPKNRAWGDVTKPPSTIFVRTDLVSHFYSSLFPCISNKFALIVGDRDMTTPRQTDRRYTRCVARDLWESLVLEPNIVHIFVEHLDEAPGPKVTPIPLGLNEEEFLSLNPDDIISHIAPASHSLLERQLKILQVDRLREGLQWEDRKHVRDLCATVWSEFCIQVQTTPGEPFWKAIRDVPFVLCVHGGGIDPNPKAWETLLLGSIPILQHFPGEEMYYELPVVFVDGWYEIFLSESNMRRWLKLLSPFFTDPDKRKKVVDMLHSDFYWGQVERALNGTIAEWKARRIDRVAVDWR